MRLPRALLALPLALALLPAIPADGTSLVEDVALLVDGEAAHGLVARPMGNASGVVVILHGYGHFAESHRGHLQHLAEQGYAAAAMDYRGGAGMHLGAGAADSCAALAHLRTEAPNGSAYLYSVSMGGAVAGMVLAECPGFSYWVSNEGMTTVAETWAEATALAPANAYAARAVADIEAECGGTPAEAPLCYQERTAVTRVPEFAGLLGVVQTHGLNDGLVPYDQGRELNAALRAAGIPVDFYTVVRSAQGTEGTTLTGYAPLGGMGLAGHGTESDDDHALTALSFALLDEVLAGTLVPSGEERVVDEGLGTLP